MEEAKPPTETAIVLLNFGGPRSADEVEPFLTQLFGDPDVIQLPFDGALRERFARTLGRRRTAKAGPQYAAIGYSPLVATTMAQADLVRAALGPGAPPLLVGMRYGEPSIRALGPELKRLAPARIVALALFPHYSGTTTGSAYNELARALAAAGLADTPVHHVPAFHDHPDYVAAVADLIATTARSARDPARVHLLFSAHGLPSSYYRAGDPYPTHVEESVRAIARAADWRGPLSLAFQSKVGPVRWLEPSTEDELRRLAAAGDNEVLLVPISFTTEGIETLYEVDVTFRQLASALGLSLLRVPTVDVHPRFIAALVALLRAALADEAHHGTGHTRCVRCLLPKPETHRTRVVCPDCHFRLPEYLLRLPPVRRP